MRVKVKLKENIKNSMFNLGLTNEPYTDYHRDVYRVDYNEFTTVVTLNNRRKITYYAHNVISVVEIPEEGETQ